MSNVVDLFAAFATNTEAEKEGTLTQLPDCGDTMFRIARIGNGSYKRLLSSLYKKNRAVLDSKGEAAEAKSNEILAEVYSKTILLGWEGTVMAGGPKTYSQELAKKLLLLPDFREKVEQVASDFATFKASKDEEDAGN